MKKRVLLYAWGGMFIVCAGLGFIPAAPGWPENMMAGLSVLFFLPGALLLWQAHKDGDLDSLRLVRNLSILSLSLTLALLLANVASVLASETVGAALYAMLVVVSAPMLCGRLWGVSLFFWACLLMCSLRLLRKKAKKSA